MFQQEGLAYRNSLAGEKVVHNILMTHFLFVEKGFCNPLFLVCLQASKCMYNLYDIASEGMHDIASEGQSPLLISLLTALYYRKGVFCFLDI